ncbi:hypothetical protein [Candidatus Aalborgicola defluviihabitans]|uniref:hypothetical protein n=1 Tax=Candidatus Aalborgicola defluviihabitans TaxID=3386187 RepID=UPI0039B89129
MLLSALLCMSAFCMLGAARWPARYLFKHPGVIDEPAGNALFEELFDPADFEQELERRSVPCKAAAKMTMRPCLTAAPAHHADVFRIPARDV